MLTGEVVSKGVDSLILLAGGVGYELAVPIRTSADLQIGESAQLFVAENIREDAYDLFGYQTAEERSLHFKLVGVQGVGPKLAHAILSVHDAPVLKDLIETEDIVRLNQVSGVGKKTAQRLLLDLKGKLVDLSGSGGLDSRSVQDPALQALIQLGFAQDQAIQALREIDSSLTTSDRVRQALKDIGR